MYNTSMYKNILVLYYCCLLLVISYYFLFVMILDELDLMLMIELSNEYLEVDVPCSRK
jgi:hypothetical protein